MAEEKTHDKPAPVKAPMVGWYDPGQLARTGIEVVVSAFFGARADFRALEALSGEQILFPHDRDQEEIWIDYVADTGDGFAPTFAVAWLLARPEIEIEPGVKIPRGSILVMGGDEVYPTPSQEAYHQRLVGVYEAALPCDPRASEKERPKLYAIPGNHDWYDGLGCFMNLFSSGSCIGNWHTPQRRSYFALHLPFRTWLIGVDIQLESDIDNAQIEAFLELPGLSAGDRCILCSAEPDWQYRAPNVLGAAAAPRHLDRLRERLEARGVSIVLQLAGDQHHYRRQSDASGQRHLVTAGGGGAFLHPTHTNAPDPVELQGRSYSCQAEKDFPSRQRSRIISWQNWAFLLKNPRFGIAAAVLYVIIGLVMPPPSEPAGPWYVRGAEVLLDALAAMAQSPASTAWVLAVLGGFFAFTDTHKRWYRYVGGLGHGTAHLACALAGALAAAHAQKAVLHGVHHRLGAALGSAEFEWASIRVAHAASLLAYAGSLAVWGYVFGSLLFGLYLWASVLVFGRHGNEAFSSIKHEGYKNFLRLRVAKDAIEVFAIGLERTPAAGSWRWTGGTYEPAETPEPKLLDRFEARV